MALHHAASGEIVELASFDVPSADSGGERSRALVRGDGIEVMRLVLRAGDSIPQHAVRQDPVTIQCLRGRVRLAAHDRTQELSAGSLVYLAPGVRHGLSAVEHAVLLMTVVLPRRGAPPPVAEGGGN